MNEPTVGTTPALSLLGVRAPRLGAGDRVDVQNRFDGTWSDGFEVAEVLGSPSHRIYRIRRLSDGAVLPHGFDHGAVTETRSPSVSSGAAQPIPLDPTRQPALGLLAS